MDSLWFSLHCVRYCECWIRVLPVIQCENTELKRNKIWLFCLMCLMPLPNRYIRQKQNNAMNIEIAVHPKSFFSTFPLSFTNQWTSLSLFLYVNWWKRVWKKTSPRHRRTLFKIHLPSKSERGYRPE